MEITLRTYKVKENDTIKDVAKNHGLETHELIAYHNKRAALHEKIDNRIPNFLNEIILPPEGYILKDGKEIWAKDNEPEPNTIQKPFIGKIFCKPYKKDLCYGVLKTIKSGEKEQTIKYTTSLRFYPKDVGGEYYVSIDITSKTFINDQEPSLIADELALSCTQVLYPLILQIDKDSNIIEIQNHDAILKRWEKQKSTKLKYYKGETAQNYFTLFEQTLINKELCLSLLKNDWFFQLYFNNIYITYLPDNLKDKQKEEIITFPIIPNTTPVEFEIKKNATIFTKNNRIRLDAKGICTDRRSKIELEQKFHFPSFLSNKPSVTGKYRTLYFLKPNNNRIQTAFLECDLELSKPKYVSISISETDDTTTFENKRHPESIEKQHENKPSFWKSLFS